MLVTDRTFAARAERVSRADAVTVDIESDGLTPWNGSRAVGVAVEVDGEADYFPFRHEPGGNLHDGALLNLLECLYGKTLGGWNLRFDLTTLSYELNGDWCLKAKTEDGIVDALLVNENEDSFSLESIANKYLGPGAAGEKQKMADLLAERFPHVRSAKERKGNLWRLHPSEVAPYACDDVLLPRRLREKYAPSLAAWGLTDLAREMNAYNLLLGRMQRDGILIDVDRCRQLAASTGTRQAAVLADLRQVAGLEFNPFSWRQVTKITGTPNAREATLERSKHPIARGTIDYKKLGKAKVAYYDAILRLVDSSGYIHPQLNLTRDPSDSYGTRTGRLSCAHPNFQALPHADDDPNAIYQVRDLVIARPGFKLFKMDYERAEVWMAASFCGDPKLAAAYHENRDLYAEMAAKLKISRHAAKILFLMIQYGAGAWKIAQFLGCSEVEAKTLKAAFFALYPSIRRAMNGYSDAWEQKGSLRLWTGRAVHYPGDRPYAGWNRVIQGAVAEMIRQAMQTLEPLLAQLGARMILQVHDELVGEYPEDAEHDVIRTCVYVMTNFDQFALRPRVEPKVSSTNYAEMQAYQEAA